MSAYVDMVGVVGFNPCSAHHPDLLNIEVAAVALPL
jgi:hypothetical protein